MSVGPLGGIAGSIAGSPLAQTKGSETERSQQDAGTQQRRVETARRAEAAAGIGQTDGQDHETDERDADGRRLWEAPAKPEEPETAPKDGAAGRQPHGKDASGQSGNLLDLSG